LHIAIQNQQISDREAKEKEVEHFLLLCNAHDCVPKIEGNAEHSNFEGKLCNFLLLLTQTLLKAYLLIPRRLM